MNLKFLAREINFALQRTCDWQSCTTLLAATARFHLENKLGYAQASPSAININILLGNTPHKLQLREHTGDVFILYEVLAFGAYHFPEIFLRSDSVNTIVDCGANIGITSLYLAEKYPLARIFAIEPDPKNFELLIHNTANIDRIVPLQAAIVGTPVDSVQFSTDQPAWGNRIIGEMPTGDSQEVAALTMDELIAGYGIDQIDLLKVDIEGGEVDLFTEHKFLSKVGLIAIELHGEYTVEHFQNAIAPAAFHVSAANRHPGVQIVTARPKFLAARE